MKQIQDLFVMPFYKNIQLQHNFYLNMIHFLLNDIDKIVVVLNVLNVDLL